MHWWKLYQNVFCEFIREEVIMLEEEENEQLPAD